MTSSDDNPYRPPGKPESVLADHARESHEWLPTVDSSFVIEGRSMQRKVRLHVHHDRLEVSSLGQFTIFRNEPLYERIRLMASQQCVQFQSAAGGQEIVGFGADDAARLRDWMGPPTRDDLKGTLRREFSGLLGGAVLLIWLSVSMLWIDFGWSSVGWLEGSTVVMGLLAIFAAAQAVLWPRSWNFVLQAAIWFSAGIVLAVTSISAALSSKPHELLLLVLVAWMFYSGIKPVRNYLLYRGSEYRLPFREDVHLV